MRVISYNVLDGGVGRADPLATVIESQRPDVVVLVEADDADVVDRIARRLRFDAIRARGKGDHAFAVLSRYPIVETIDHGPNLPALSDGLLEAVVADPDGREWSIGAVHLQAHALERDEDRRMEEVEAVLGTFAAHRAENRPHLLAGDFNANAPTQHINPECCKPSTREEWAKNGNRLPRRVVQRLLDAGYLDTYHTARRETADQVGTFSTHFPGQRVDYLFAFGVTADRIKTAWVEQDRLATYASDHYPVGVEIG